MQVEAVSSATITPPVTSETAPVAKPKRRLRYLRRVLEALTDEIEIDEDRADCKSRGSEVVLLVKNKGKTIRKPSEEKRVIRERKEAADEESGGGSWSYVQEGGKTGDVIFFHPNGTIVELVASSNGWFRVKSREGEFVVFPGPSTSNQGMPEHKNKGGRRVNSSLNINLSGWKIRGNKFSATQSSGVDITLTSRGEMLYGNNPLKHTGGW